MRKRRASPHDDELDVGNGASHVGESKRSLRISVDTPVPPVLAALSLL